MESPGFDLSADRRHPLGWFALGFLGLLLVTLQLVSYLSRPRDVLPFGQMEMILETTVIQNLAMDQMLKMARMGSAKSTFKDAGNLEETISRLAPLRKTNARAAGLYAAMRQEQGRPIRAEDLAALRESTKAQERALAAVYGSTTLERSAAEQLDRELKSGEGFVYRLAAIHALEKAGERGVRAERLGERVAPFLFALFVYASAGLLGACLWFAYVLARHAGKLAPLGHAAGVLTEADGDRFAMRGAQVLFLIFACPTLAGVMLMGQSSGVVMLVSGVLMTLATVALFRMPVFGKLLPRQAIGLHRGDLGRNVLWGVGGALASIPLVLGLSILGQALLGNLPAPEHPLTQRLQTDQGLFLVLGTMLAATIVVPAFEEIAFRGFMAPAFTTLFRNRGLGILASSLLFAAVHPTGIPAWPALAGVGAMAALVAYQTRSLVPAIVLHGVHNLLTLLLVIALF